MAKFVLMFAGGAFGVGMIGGAFIPILATNTMT